ncbi:hypothetical protein E2F50_19415 [Rhizobium deserti]|uniref:Uncharacterized protein n=1 Tax=Rhizobium deserti TaxID=2547961 RepID=A0A4R5UB42_9HYPH|nr:hypothetical protein [Rhizobium deserti]TDK31833.1 hypothetical protein E2F50_19415 [Rhizobium deserti]
MPYYLVTHTSLIEALDEATAASAAMENLRVAEKIPLTVKLDDEHITHIVVSQRPDDRPGLEGDGAVEGTGLSDLGAVAQKTAPPAGYHRLPINAKITVLLVACLSLGLVSGLILSQLSFESGHDACAACKDSSGV